MPAGFAHVPFGNMNALRAAMGPHVAAVMIESVQGEGGAKQVPDNYLADARAAADEFGALLIADECRQALAGPVIYFLLSQAASSRILLH